MSERTLDELSRVNSELVNLQRALAKKNAELVQALARIQRLEGLLSVCMDCHRIRSEGQNWTRLEKYIAEHSDAQVSHGLCPDCFERRCPDEAGR